MTNDNLDIVLNPSELSEAASQTAVVTFGRMNPPTVGHLALVKKMLQISQQKQAKPLIFLSHSVDSKKNPLSYNDKAKLINMAFGRIVQKSNAKNIFDMLKELSGNYENLVIVVGSDRVKDLKRISTTYNGKDFNFKNIEVVSAGTRDPDSDGVTGMSATKMRDAAAKNDLQAFKRGLPNQLNKYAEKILKMVREGMNLKEDLDNIFEEHLDEAGVLTVAGRRKKAIAARRYKARLKVARRRVARRLAQTGRIKKRTARAAIRVMRNRLAGSRGKSYSKLSPQEKASIDRRVRQRGSIVKKLSARIMPVTRRKEFARFKSFRTKKESVNLAFSSYLTENNHKEIQPISEKVLNNIIKKSIASEIPVNILSEVYDKYRGKGDSFAFNRLNEFIAKSATSEMDELFESFIAELSPETIVSFMKKRTARSDEHGKLKLDATSKKEYKYHDGQQRKNFKGVMKAISHAGNTLKRRARKAGYRVSEEAYEIADIIIESNLNEAWDNERLGQTKNYVVRGTDTPGHYKIRHKQTGERHHISVDDNHPFSRTRHVKRDLQKNHPEVGGADRHALAKHINRHIQGTPKKTIPSSKRSVNYAKKDLAHTGAVRRDLKKSGDTRANTKGHKWNPFVASEEVVNELSTATLKSYKKKSASDEQRLRDRADHLVQRDSQKRGGRYDMPDADNAADKYERARKRSRGQRLASYKLWGKKLEKHNQMKEENIQEISKDLASRYIKRAAGSAISNADKTQYHTSKMFQKQDAGDNKGAKKEFKAGRDPSRKTMNRFYGIQRAAGKLNKNDKDKGEYLGHSMTKQKTSSKIKATEETINERNTAVKISPFKIKATVGKAKPIPGHPDYKGPANPKPKVKLNDSPGNIRKKEKANEEKVQDNIQELSSKTLKNYIKKAASTNIYHKNSLHGLATTAADKLSNSMNQQDRGIKGVDDGEKEDRKAINRGEGIKKAAKKLYSRTNEEKVQDNIQELSSKTMSNYIRKAASPVNKNSAVNLASKAATKLGHSWEKVKAGDRGHYDDGEKEDRKAFNRARGIQTAAKKLYGRTNEEKVQEGNKPGLWDNIHAKRKRIKAGSGERMRKPGSKGAPTAKNFRDAAESKDYGLSGPAYGRPRLGYTGDRVVKGQKGYKEYMAQAKIKKLRAKRKEQQGIKEEGGAGLMGTDALLKRYIMDTPGQTPSKDLAIDGVPGKGGVIHKQEPLKGLGQSGKQKVQSYKDYLNAKKS